MGNNIEQGGQGNEAAEPSRMRRFGQFVVRGLTALSLAAGDAGILEHEYRQMLEADKADEPPVREPDIRFSHRQRAVDDFDLHIMSWPEFTGQELADWVKLARR